MLTDTFANLALDSLFPAAAELTVGLSTTRPALDATVAGGATNITEPTGGAYARVTITGASFAAAASRIKATSAAITFPAPSAAWGAVGWVVVWSGTDVLLFGQLNEVIDVIADGDQIRIPAGTLSVSFPA